MLLEDFWLSHLPVPSCYPLTKLNTLQLKHNPEIWWQFKGLKLWWVSSWGGAGRRRANTNKCSLMTLGVGKWEKLSQNFLPKSFNLLHITCIHHQLPQSSLNSHGQVKYVEIHGFACSQAHCYLWTIFLKCILRFELIMWMTFSEIAKCW